MADKSESKKPQGNPKSESSQKGLNDKVKIALISTVGPIVVAIVTFLIAPVIIAKINKPTPVEPSPIVCSYPSDYNENESIVWLIEKEADAVVHKDMKRIKEIFADNAKIVDYFDKNNPVSWSNPIERYQPLFKDYDFSSAENTDIKAVGSINGGVTQYYISGSHGQYKTNGQTFPPFLNPGDANHWTLEQIEGCWKIIKFDFNASGIKFP